MVDPMRKPQRHVPEQIYWVCVSVMAWAREVKGSKGTPYVVTFGRDHKRQQDLQYDFACSCPGYSWNPGYCRHINEVKGERCGWDQFEDGGEPIRLVNGKIQCPKCKGPVMAVRYGG